MLPSISSTKPASCDPQSVVDVGNHLFQHPPAIPERPFEVQVTHHLRTLRPHDLFTAREVADTIEAEFDHKLDADAVNEISELLHHQWGSGIEPAVLGGELWKFGYGKPPISQELGHR